MPKTSSELLTTSEHGLAVKSSTAPDRVLISCFACGPNWGSEVGMGWHWVTNLARYRHLHVITEMGFQEEIEAALPALQLAFSPCFHYIDIGAKGRELFWKQGSLLFYAHYRRWQKEALALAEQLLAEESIGLIHQLNLIGFREPGYLWKLAERVPFVWGPIGGFNQVPVNYIREFNAKNTLFYLGKNLIHSAQVRYHPRVRKALTTAGVLLAESRTTQEILEKTYGVESILMNETGGDFEHFHEHTSFFSNQVFQLLWVGKIQGPKALPIALLALKKIQGKVPFHLTVVGDGPDETHCRNLAGKLGIAEHIQFTGRIPNQQVRELMKRHDLLFFTSLKEGTPHVVLEALSNGLPVLCHDACGHGDIIDDSCGLKVPMIDHNTSIEQFAGQIMYLYRHPDRLRELSAGARFQVEKHSWKNKAREMAGIYQQLTGLKTAQLSSST